MKQHLIIFARAPRLGAVKKRLAQSIGELAALRFHRLMLNSLLHRLSGDRRWRCWLALTPDIRIRNNFYPSQQITFIPQGKGDIGERMANCFRALPPGPAILIGTDIPDITHAHITHGFAVLGSNDLLFGPARDGGYWLVGMKRLRPMPRGLFKSVRWSGPHALADTITSAGKHNRIASMETLSDIDTAEDYAHWRRLCSSSRGMISTKLQGRNR